MTKVIFVSVATLLISLQAFSQTCNLVLNDGGKLTTTVTTYTNPLANDPKFIKEKKQEKKDAMIAAFNAEVLSGAKVPATTTPSTASIYKKRVNETDQYTMVIKMGVYEFNYYLDCRNDTIFTYLHSGQVPVGFDPKKPSGYRVESPMVLPMNLS